MTSHEERRHQHPKERDAGFPQNAGNQVRETKKYKSSSGRGRQFVHAPPTQDLLKKGSESNMCVVALP